MVSANQKDDLKALRRQATWFLGVYLFLILASVLVSIFIPDSVIGLVSLIILGMPWAMLWAPCSWAIMHNTSEGGLVFLFLISTVPNLVILIRKIGKLYFEEKVQILD